MPRLTADYKKRAQEYILKHVLEIFPIEFKHPNNTRNATLNYYDGTLKATIHTGLQMHDIPRYKGEYFADFSVHYYGVVLGENITASFFLEDIDNNKELKLCNKMDIRRRKQMNSGIENYNTIEYLTS